jgi:hypothetical protein
MGIMCGIVAVALVSAVVVVSLALYGLRER